MPTFPFVTRPTELNTEHCLNRKHYQAACTRCSDLCPTRALAVSATGEVSLTLDACLGCGLCLHSCPAEVFTTDRWSERTPLKNVSDLRAEQVAVFCERHQAAVGTSASDSVRVPTCLAAMSPGIWFEFGLSRAVQVRLDACAGCPLESTTAAVEHAVDTANAWLRDAGHEPRVTCTYVADDRAPTARREVIDGRHVRMSRRGFFRTLFSAPKGLQPEESSDPQELTWTGDQSPKQQPRLPAWMAAAAHAYARHSRPTAEPAALLPNIVIDSACTHCRACTRYCPTGALEVNVSAENYAITFNPGQCVDCRICWASCPVGAITRSQQPTAEPFTRRTVFQQRTSSCSHCGQPAEFGRDLCYWCAAEPPLDPIMIDVRRWLFTAVDVPSVDQLR